MKIIQDILEELIQTEKSLAGPLFKGKFLASRIGNTELLNWINNELTGYKVLPDLVDDHIPAYRKHGASLIGSYLIGLTPFENMTLPTAGLDEQVADFMRTTTLYDSVAALEKKAEDSKSDLIGQMLSPELNFLIEKSVKKANPYFRLISARKQSPATVITQTLTSIRSTFLDFILALDAEFGEIVDIDDLRDRNDTINTIMNNTIINNSGDGALINTGDKAKIENRVKISKNDLDAIAKVLKENFVPDADIFELQEILKNDQPDNEKRIFGKEVNGWVSKMISKSLDGSWAIGIGAAGDLLADALKLFYGWN